MKEPGQSFRLPPAAHSQMFRLPAGILLLSAFLAAGLFTCRAQIAQPPLPFAQSLSVSDQAHLRWLVNHAALVFSATVLSAKRVAVGDSLTAADVVFQLESNIRGASGSTLELKFLEEPGTVSPLAPMQRVVLFLHAPNAAGITSPVANNCGMLTRTAGDRVDLKHLQFCPSAFAEEHAAKYVAGDEGLSPGHLRHFASAPGPSVGETTTSIVLEWLRAMNPPGATTGQAVDRASRVGSALTRVAAPIAVQKTATSETSTVRLAQ